jgi:colanic acid/amylovoran biosynthesis glycosyltransferase
MRLLYVTVSMPFGPGEAFLVPEVLELLRQGHEVLIVPRSPKRVIVNQDAEGLERHSLRRFLLSPYVLFIAAWEAVRHPEAAARSLALLLRNGNLRVVAKNAVVFPKGLWLAGVARKWRADHIHAHWGLTTATMAMVASEVTGITWSLTLHRGDIADPNMLAMKIASAAFTRFISQSGVHMAEGPGNLGHAGRACVIHMGVALPAQPSMRTTSKGPFIVLCPAHLYLVKGHEYLIQAMAILQEREMSCALRLAGEGRLRKELEHQVDTLGLGATISFLGQVPHERILEWYRDGQIDAVVLPSIDLGNNMQEGIPVALMEAMAHGIPVVSTETGGIPELLRDGAGIMVPPQDPEALADAIQQLIRDPALRVQLGIAGRRRVADHFAVERTVTELSARIEATVGNTRTRPA